MLNHSTLQPLNPDRASEWPKETEPNRAREPPMRTGPVVRLSAVQVAERETRHGSQHERRGPHCTQHTIPDPPPPLKAEWQGGSRIQLSTIDQGEIILTIRELHVQFWTPPPPINDRMERGSRNESLAVDLGGWTLAIQILLATYLNPHLCPNLKLASLPHF
jgi:hypothetical protein